MAKKRASSSKKSSSSRGASSRGASAKKTVGLTKGQKKLPPALQAHILKKKKR